MRTRDAAERCCPQILTNAGPPLQRMMTTTGVEASRAPRFHVCMLTSPWAQRRRLMRLLRMMITPYVEGPLRGAFPCLYAYMEMRM